jgi:glycosyltransferase involved in cell wall biosynthesis
MKSSLNILMVAPQPFFSARGTPFSVLHRIRALLDLGHKVDLVTYGYGEDIEMEGLTIYRSAKLPLISKIKIGPSIPKIFLDILLYWDTRKALKNKKYDVFHSHEEAAFFGLSLCKKHGLPHLYDMHSSLPLQLSNFKAYNISSFRKVFEYLENKVLASCDAVITICDELGQIVDSTQPEKPHLMIENIGDDRKVFQPNGRDWQSELDIKDESVLLYTGTFEAYQGIDLFIDSLPAVLKRQPGAIALLVGGNPEQVEHYRAYAQEKGVAANVRFTGTVHPSNIPGLIDLSSIIVSPRSRGTNTPLKIYNYCRTGKPLVATDRLTHTQILNSDISCLVEATAEEFAGGIIKVLEDRQYAQDIASAAQEFAKEHFSDERYVEMVGEIYDLMEQGLSAKRGY